jgi:hypothetical protein
MLTQRQVNDKLLADRWITPKEHARLIVRNGRVWDDSNASFDVTEAGDVKLRGSSVWLKGYAKSGPCAPIREN